MVRNWSTKSLLGEALELVKVDKLVRGEFLAKQVDQNSESISILSIFSGLLFAASTASNSEFCESLSRSWNARKSKREYSLLRSFLLCVSAPAHISQAITDRLSRVSTLKSQRESELNENKLNFEDFGNESVENPENPVTSFQYKGGKW